LTAFAVEWYPVRVLVLRSLALTVPFALLTLIGTFRDASAVFCARLNQEVLKADAALVPGSTTLARMIGAFQTSSRVVSGTMVIYPVANRVRVTATIYPATDPGELSYLNFIVDLASGAGSGTFSKSSGSVGPLTFQAIPCS